MSIPTGPVIPTEDLEKNGLYEAAFQEVCECIPPQLKEATLIRLDDVRTLMVAAWLRGATWERTYGEKVS